MRTRAELVALIVGLLVAGTAALALPRVIAPFEETFASFGAELPIATALLLQHTYLLWLLPVVVLAVWLVWPSTKRRVAATYVASIGGTVTAYVATVILLQWPVHQLGASLAA